MPLLEADKLQKSIHHAFLDAWQRRERAQRRPCLELGNTISGFFKFMFKAAFTLAGRRRGLSQVHEAPLCLLELVGSDIEIALQGLTIVGFKLAFVPGGIAFGGEARDSLLKYGVLYGGGIVLWLGLVRFFSGRSFCRRRRFNQIISWGRIGGGLVRRLYFFGPRRTGKPRAGQAAVEIAYS